MERTQDFEICSDDLWEAVSDPDRLAGWLGDEVDLDVRPGGEGRVTDDGETRRVVVDEVIDGQRLAFTWWPERNRHEVSHVELIVLPLPAGSRLVVRETLAASARWELRMAVLGLRCAALVRV